MANKNQPIGARPYGDVKEVVVLKSGSAIYPGDFLKRNNAGQVVPVATDGSSYTGSCCGVAMDYASASGKDITVCIDPQQLWVVQAHGSTISSMTNKNYPILATAPDSTYKKSKMELDDANGDTTATLPLRLVSVYREQNNQDLSSANPKLIVKINNDEFASGTGTAGI